MAVARFVSGGAGERGRKSTVVVIVPSLRLDLRGGLGTLLTLSDDIGQDRDDGVDIVAVCDDTSHDMKARMRHWHRTGVGSDPRRAQEHSFDSGTRLWHGMLGAGQRFASLGRLTVMLASAGALVHRSR